LFGHSGETFLDAFFQFTPGPSDFDATQGAPYATPLGNILDTNLALNGGTTVNNTLVPGSPALDKAPNADCTAFPIDDVDQRDFPRNVDYNPPPGPNDCDIGAIELQIGTAVNVAGVRVRNGKPGIVNLKWQTLTESEIAGFEVHRKVAKGKWRKVSGELIQAKHTGDPAGAQYRFKDKKARAGKTYNYKVKVHYRDGHTEWTAVVKLKTGE
jgi:hypothetical protein